MAKVLTTASTLTCGAAAPHAGKLAATGSDLMRANGAAVLRKPAVQDASINGCTNQSSSTTKCTAIATVSAGVATRLKVDGEFVALSSLEAVTNGVPPSSVVVADAADELLRAE